MKLITVSGPPSSGKTSVILKLVDSLRESGVEKIGAVKFDCLTSFDQIRYRESGEYRWKSDFPERYARIIFLSAISRMQSAGA